MSNPYPLKEVVKVLTITKPTQKIRFQIRHPENVYSITGIAVTCSLVSILRGGGGSSTAGTLTLAIADKGDVVFNEDVKRDNNDYIDEIEKQINATLFSKELSFSGKRLTYFETQFIITEAVLDGFYEDTFYANRGDVIPRDTILYKVTIYIRYQTFKTADQ